IAFFNSHLSSIFFLIIRPPPTSTLFPYTTLFRSDIRRFWPINGWAMHSDTFVIILVPHRRIGKPFDSTLTTGRLTVNWLPYTPIDRKSTRLNSSHLVISYAVFCLKKKKNILRMYT